MSRVRLPPFTRCTGVGVVRRRGRYGDLHPVTTAGQVVTVIIIIVGLIELPVQINEMSSYLGVTGGEGTWQRDDSNSSAMDTTHTRAAALARSDGTGELDLRGVSEALVQVQHSVRRLQADLRLAVTPLATAYAHAHGSQFADGSVNLKPAAAHGAPGVGLGLDKLPVEAADGAVAAGGAMRGGVRGDAEGGTHANTGEERSLSSQGADHGAAAARGQRHAHAAQGSTRRMSGGGPFGGLRLPGLGGGATRLAMQMRSVGHAAAAAHSSSATSTARAAHSGASSTR